MEAGIFLTEGQAPCHILIAPDGLCHQPLALLVPDESNQQKQSNHVSWAPASSVHHKSCKSTGLADTHPFVLGASVCRLNLLCQQCHHMSQMYTGAE